MANTENIEAKLCAYIDGDLDAVGRAEIEKHLAANPQHRGLIAQLSKQRDLLRELPRESAPDEILDALQSQMERSVLLGDADTGAEAEAMKIHRWPQLLAAAAIVILTVGLGAVIYFVLPRNTNTGNYARVTEPGATFEATTGPTESNAMDMMGPTEDRLAGTVERSAAQPKASTRAPTSGVPTLNAPTLDNEPPSSIAMAPVPEGGALQDASPQTAAPQTPAADALAKEKSAADVFAPARAGGGELAIASNDLVDAQYRLQSADLARQLKDSPGGLQDNAMFVVVSTADPSAARSEVTDYLASNNIAWESVLQPMPDPVIPAAGQDISLTRAQRLNVQMKQESLPAGQQAAPPEEQLKKMEAKSDLAGGAAADDRAALDAEQRAKGSSGPLQRSEQLGVADGGEKIAEPSDVASNSIQPNAGLLQATTQAQQLIAPAQPIVPAQPDATGRLIIARGMTRQQATELSSNLSKQTTVQRAAVYEQRPIPAAASPVATTSPFTSTREFTAVPTTNPTTTYFGEAQQAVIDSPTTQETAGQETAGHETAEQETARPATTTAPAPIPLGASETIAIAKPTTQQSGGIDERVDVVILVEDDIIPPAEMEQPVAPTPPPDAAPATAPATQESPADHPLF